MSAQRVVILGAQVPFIRGGAERLNDALVTAINDNLPGVSAELVQLPFKWYPETQLLKDTAAWRLLDLSESNGKRIDLCIATKYPTYAARHDNKVTWLVHQHRVFYDLENSEYDVPHNSAVDSIVRKKVRSSDTRFLQESKAIYSISATVSDRLQRFNGLASTPVYPPPALSAAIQPGPYGNYVLYIGRVERIKRIDPLVQALQQLPELQVVIVGTGEHLATLQTRARELGVADRCRFEGYVSDQRYLQLLAECRAVYYGPLDEDYGFATIEALLARKPVLTWSDSGEVASILQRTGAGCIVQPGSGQLEQAIEQFLAMSDRQLADMTAAGHDFARGITWTAVLDQLVAPHL